MGAGILIAKKGEVVSCPEGHDICEVAKDIFSHDVVRIGDFKNWRVTEPEIGKPVKPCACGREYITTKMHTHRRGLYIKGSGWRNVA